MLSEQNDYILERCLQELKNNLQQLHLGVNKITEIKENSFSGLNNLQKLSLVGNQITEIKENAFSGFNNLQELHLDRNQISESNMSRLKKLGLAFF